MASHRRSTRDVGLKDSAKQMAESKAKQWIRTVLTPAWVMALFGLLTVLIAAYFSKSCSDGQKVGRRQEALP